MTNLLGLTGPEIAEAVIKSPRPLMVFPNCDKWIQNNTRKALNRRGYYPQQVSLTLVEGTLFVRKKTRS